MEVRDSVLDYLYKSGFVENYCKKLIWPCDKAEYQDDYIGETWLQICEVSEDKWKQLMDNNTNKDPYYTVRNWVSMLIHNTVKSTTSAAYRKLKKQSTVAEICTEEEWSYLSNVVPDEMRMF